MAEIADLDVLFPEDDIVKFKGKTDGKEYEIKLFIPSAVGFLIIENIDIITGLFPSGNVSSKPKVTKKVIDLLKKILTEICRNQNPEINEKWVEANISLPRQAFIIYKLALPIYDFLVSTGYMESVTPVPKKPEAETESISPE